MCGVMAAVRVGQIGIRDSFASLFRGFFPSLSIARIMISLGEGKEEGGIKCELFFPTLRNASAFLREPTLLASPGSNISLLPNLVCQEKKVGKLPLNSPLSLLRPLEFFSFGVMIFAETHRKPQ